MDVTSGIFAITIVCENLAASRSFYSEKLGLPVLAEDADSVVFSFGPTMVNLLDIASAPELVGPAPVGADRDGVRAVYTVRVADVDEAAAELASAGVALLNGPVDRPWGPRTLSFRDPSGTVWELSSH